MGKYYRYTESALVTLAANNDSEAVVELLLVRYRDSLVSAARTVNAKYNDEDLNDILQSFAERNIKPDSNGNWRLRGIAAGKNPKAYVIKSFKNYLLDEYRKDKLDIVDPAPEEGRTGDTDEPGRYHTMPEEYDEGYEIHPKTQKELQIAAIFEALDSLGALSAKERYILVTFLLGERFRGDGAKPLKIREQIGLQLGERPSTVYNRYADLKGALSRKAAQYLQKMREGDL